MLNGLRRLVSQDAVWPSIDYELIDPRKKGYLSGLVLNAGAGWRDLSHLIDGELVNQDLEWPDETRTNIHIFSPLASIPRPDATFDSILCIAVLEHVDNPIEVVAEFHRALKPGGHVVASVPFLQPEHKIPTDFQRYTRDGLATLFARAGFEVVDVYPIFTIYHTLHWIAFEWLSLKNSPLYKMLKLLMLPPLVFMTKRSRLSSEKLASVFQIIARKPLAN